ncbi:MAG: PrnB family protein [Gammaproteobacteria bacterium]
MTNTPSSAFDHWIRGRFPELNTALEDLYFAQEDRADTQSAGGDIKAELLAQGSEHVRRLLAEGNTDQGFDRGFDVLGNVGLFMAACERHGITQHASESQSQLTEASALAMQIGASLGVAPRFATSHLATHNRAIDGRYKSFTLLRDEYVFTEYNTRGVLAYKRAADALLRILPLGISHPVAHDLLVAARDALQEVARHNEALDRALDVDRFFYCVRPYFKPHRVGLHVYRGANAGDFAGINIIDLLLGLCRADHPSYSQILVDKFLYMMPEDQLLLRDCMRRQSLLDALLAALDAGRFSGAIRENAAMFLEVCVAHGHTAVQHHDWLVARFIAKPSEGLAAQHHQNLTASGPPLPVLLRALERLRDLRAAAVRDDIPSRHAALARLRAALG